MVFPAIGAVGTVFGIGNQLAGGGGGGGGGGYTPSQVDSGVGYGRQAGYGRYGRYGRGEGLGGGSFGGAQPAGGYGYGYGRGGGLGRGGQAYGYGATGGAGRGAGLIQQPTTLGQLISDTSGAGGPGPGAGPAYRGPGYGQKYSPYTGESRYGSQGQTGGGGGGGGGGLLSDAAGAVKNLLGGGGGGGGLPGWASLLPLAGGAAQAVSSYMAARQMANAAKYATQKQYGMFQKTQANLAPFIKAGTGALGPWESLLGIYGGAGATGGTAPFSNAQINAALQNMPGYQFTLTQGLNALQNRFSAGGQGISGAAMTGAQQYGAGLAAGTYGDIVNRIAALGTLGANAAAGLGTTSANVGSNIAGSIMAGGQATGAGILGAGGGVASGASGVANYALMNAILNRQPGSTPLLTG